jgi:hypothetical protein
MTETNNNRYTTYYFFTRKEFDELLNTSFDERKKRGLPIFGWEHCAKSFQYISNDLAMKHLMEMKDKSNGEDRIILKCKYNSDVYYFGVGLKDSENISLKKLKQMYQYGSWSVYTWCD